MELHGTIYQNHCISCEKLYNAKYVFNCVDIPKCICGSIIKPDVILYEELLDENIINKSIKYISECELLIVAGTSLTVYPASGFVKYFKGKYLVIINNDKTNYDKFATMTIHDKVGNVFSKLKI